VLKLDVYAKINLFHVLLPQNEGIRGQVLNCCFVNVMTFEPLLTVKNFKLCIWLFSIWSLSELSCLLSESFLIKKFVTESYLRCANTWILKVTLVLHIVNKSYWPIIHLQQGTS
jgi:hypothetical protein